MADQNDDLSISTKLVRAARRIPAAAADLARPSAEATPAPPPAIALGSLRSGTQPAQVPAWPRPTMGSSSVALHDGEVEPKALVIGQGISVSGQIDSCDRVLVAGSVQANLQGCRHLTIAETGLFTGNASVDEAEIRGRFEGELIVRNRLLIRAEGHVAGTITYGEIEVGAGGKISGTVHAPRSAGIV